MKSFKKTILITGGAGFIGSHTVRRFVRAYPDYLIVNLDLLTYAGNLANLEDIAGAPNYVFEKGDICDAARVDALFAKYEFDGVIHLAAESHVDRSIMGPLVFVQTNVTGTAVLLEACRKYWKSGEDRLFYHISTDEVFGTLGPDGYFTEQTPYNPRSPYSASKAASDHLVMAWHHSFGLPVLLSNCSNNYGSHHFPEKLIPLMILQIRDGKPLPVYGDGQHVRDWLWVEDHARAIDLLFHRGRRGERYNIGGMSECKNIDLVKMLIRLVDRKMGRPEGASDHLIQFVKDRPGHDRRYAMDISRIRTELGWEPSITLEQGLEKTVDWYLANKAWLDQVTSGAYRRYFERQYQKS